MAEQRLINAEALLIKLSRMIDYCKKDSKVNGLTALFQVGDAIMDCPTIEAKPVVHAHWIYGETIYGVEWMKCSACCKSQTPTGVFSYCPNCGAQMDEKENKE